MNDFFVGFLVGAAFSWGLLGFLSGAAEFANSWRDFQDYRRDR